MNSLKARIGYWICSEYWGKGYTSQAFLKILCFERVKGIERVSAFIAKDNVVQ
jgi:Acetyltransferases, including N-acetylases of ribosomal proteins